MKTLLLTLTLLFAFAGCAGGTANFDEQIETRDIYVGQ